MVRIKCHSVPDVTVREESKKLNPQDISRPSIGKSCGPRQCQPLQEYEIFQRMFNDIYKVLANLEEGHFELKKRIVSIVNNQNKHSDLISRSGKTISQLAKLSTKNVPSTSEEPAYIKRLHEEKMALKKIDINITLSELEKISKNLEHIKLKESIGDQTIGKIEDNDEIIVKKIVPQKGDNYEIIVKKIVPQKTNNDGNKCFYISFNANFFRDLMGDILSKDNEYVSKLNNLIEEPGQEQNIKNNWSQVENANGKITWEMKDNGELRTLHVDPGSGATRNSLGIKETELMQTILLADQTYSSNLPKIDTTKNIAQLSDIVQECHMEIHKLELEGNIFEEKREKKREKVRSEALDKVRQILREPAETGDRASEAQNMKIKRRIEEMQPETLRNEFFNLLNKKTFPGSKKDYKDFLALIEEPLSEGDKKTLERCCLRWYSRLYSKWYKSNKRVNQNHIDDRIKYYRSCNAYRYMNNSEYEKQEYEEKLKEILSSKLSGDETNKKVSFLLKKMYQKDYDKWQRDRKVFSDVLKQYCLDKDKDNKNIPRLVSFIHDSSQKEPIKIEKIEYKNEPVITTTNLDDNNKKDEQTTGES